MDQSKYRPVSAANTCVHCGNTSVTRLHSAPKLSLREKQIVTLIQQAKSNKEIANMLNLSLYTVETHRSNILDKLNLHSVPELILYAVRKGVIS